MFFLLLILVVLIIYTVLAYNLFIELRKKVLQSESGIDVYLQQRFDLIPNLIEVTKNYMEYENNILEKLVKLRGEYNTNKSLKVANELTHEFKKIMVTVENYPVLKASEQFLELQKSLKKVESQLQAIRRIYNMNVTKYNTTISSFPNRIIAKMFGFKEFELFELDDDLEDEDMKVDFI